MGKNINKKTIKTIKKIIVYILIIIAIFSSNVFATSIVDPSKYKPTEITVNSDFTTKMGKVLGAAQAVGIVASVITLIVLGIKYMYGSIEEKSVTKKSFLPYVIGSAMLAIIPTIVQFLYDLAVKTLNS